MWAVVNFQVNFKYCELHESNMVSSMSVTFIYLVLTSLNQALPIWWIFFPSFFTSSCGFSGKYRISTFGLKKPLHGSSFLLVQRAESRKC